MIVVTVGEPAGIGPDLVVQLAQHQREIGWVAIGDANLLAQRAVELELPLNLIAIDSSTQPTVAIHSAGCLGVIDVPLAQPVSAGQLDVANAAAVMASLDRAISGCLDGSFSAMVTAPVQKSMINEAGFEFTGHTEYLAARADVPDVVMLLAARQLRVALATTHLPLSAVPAAITTELLTRRLRILNNTLQTQFGIAKPRILVAGLNPHAGESGHLGREEIEVINPVCATLREAGLDLQGPLPADTLFTPKFLATADAVMAMYHDQGLPVLKHAGFGEAVNITLGLPFIRTSVDHGTALDLAATGAAESGSLSAAITMAADMVAHARA